MAPVCPRRSCCYLQAFGRRRTCFLAILLLFTNVLKDVASAKPENVHLEEEQIFSDPDNQRATLRRVTPTEHGSLRQSAEALDRVPGVPTLVSDRRVLDAIRGSFVDDSLSIDESSHSAETSSSEQSLRGLQATRGYANLPWSSYIPQAVTNFGWRQFVPVVGSATVASPAPPFPTWEQFLLSMLGRESVPDQRAASQSVGSNLQRLMLRDAGTTSSQNTAKLDETPSFNWQQYVPLGVLSVPNQDKPQYQSAEEAKPTPETKAEKKESQEQPVETRRLQLSLPLIAPIPLYGSYPWALGTPQQTFQQMDNQTWQSQQQLFTNPLQQPLLPFQMPQAPLITMPQETQRQFNTMQERLKQMQKQVTTELQEQLEPQFQREHVWQTPGGGVAYGRFGTASASSVWNSSQSGQDAPVVQQQPQQLSQVGNQQQHQSESPNEGNISAPQLQYPPGGPPDDLLSSLMHELDNEKEDTKGGAHDSKEGLPELLQPQLLVEDKYREALGSIQQTDASPKETAGRQGLGQRPRRLGRNLAGVAGREDSRVEDRDGETNSDVERDLQAGPSWQQFIPSWTQFVPPQIFGRHSAGPVHEAQQQRSDGMNLHTRRETAYEELVLRQQQLEQQLEEIQASRYEPDWRQPRNSRQRQSEVGIQVDRSTAPKTADMGPSRDTAKLQALHKAQTAELKARQEARMDELAKKWKQETDELEQRHREQVQRLQEWQQERARAQAEQLSERQDEEWKTLKTKQSSDLKAILRRQDAIATRVQRDQTLQLQQLLALQQKQLDQAERLHQLQASLRQQERDVAQQLKIAQQGNYEKIPPLHTDSAEMQSKEEPETEKGEDSGTSSDEELPVPQSRPKEELMSGEKQEQAEQANGETGNKATLKVEGESSGIDVEATPQEGPSESAEPQRERKNGMTTQLAAASEPYDNVEADGQQQDASFQLFENSEKGAGQGESGDTANSAKEGPSDGTEPVSDEEFYAASGDADHEGEYELQKLLSSSEETGAHRADDEGVPPHDEAEKPDEDSSVENSALDVEEKDEGALQSVTKPQESLTEDDNNLQFDQEATEPSEQLPGTPTNNTAGVV
ncbi:putative glutamic acid-rich protein [Toxoplasma gondii GAB2-2007-GAL-DOM2]|uniref:Putative glutamic acid-rich protein n=4 Tax=Toxoplasma gondii TaxID=5811 RepID=A0A3R8ABG2_TOXGO|nr:putative glutamic acid-rich protein [Toxoplasma gondii GAB2-2007-GAL-DOM2]PUA84227.1 putative glutamic acid-rich protein [Toxoplasma gondii TgCATBr9]RQX71104.1 putative glutamic acid-rich protein [Toxoplasma gondii CAST]